MGTEAERIPFAVVPGPDKSFMRLDMVTNGALIRQGLVPCESNPKTGGLSRTGDPAHALAEVTVGGKGFESRHLCRGCAKEFYPYRPVKEGVIWS